jgi:hypothetical protein
MPLTDTATRTAKPKATPYKLFDGKGLYMIVTPSGGKWWRLKYRFEDKEKAFSLGTYPEITLAYARTERDKARTLVAQAIDPSVKRTTEKETRQESAANSFEAIARRR